jgi:SHS2 domain-containing protein
MVNQWTILEHPSDIGVEACGESLNDAFQSAAEGMMAVILDVSAIQPSSEQHIYLTASDREQLLVKWLSEILYLYDGKGFVCGDFNILEFTQTTLRAIVRGEPFDQNKHKPKLDLKAVTYHQILISETQAGGMVRVFFDI